MGLNQAYRRGQKNQIICQEIFKIKIERIISSKIPLFSGESNVNQGGGSVKYTYEKTTIPFKERK